MLTTQEQERKKDKKAKQRAKEKNKKKLIKEQSTAATSHMFKFLKEVLTQIQSNASAFDTIPEKESKPFGDADDEKILESPMEEIFSIV